jgi:hypothetical protein
MRDQAMGIIRQMAYGGLTNKESGSQRLDYNPNSSVSNNLYDQGSSTNQVDTSIMEGTRKEKIKDFARTGAQATIGAVTGVVDAAGSMAGIDTEPLTGKLSDLKFGEMTQSDLEKQQRAGQIGQTVGATAATIAGGIATGGNPTLIARGADQTFQELGQVDPNSRTLNTISGAGRVGSQIYGAAASAGTTGGFSPEQLESGAGMLNPEQTQDLSKYLQGTQGLSAATSLANGGPTDPPSTGNKISPLYVDRNDPAGRDRYQAYQDSSSLYNRGEEKLKYWRNNPNATNVELNRAEDEIDRRFPVSTPPGNFPMFRGAIAMQPIGSGSALRHVPLYKKPVEPVEYEDISVEKINYNSNQIPERNLAPVAPVPVSQKRFPDRPYYATDNKGNRIIAGVDVWDEKRKSWKRTMFDQEDQKKQKKQKELTIIDKVTFANGGYTDPPVRSTTPNLDALAKANPDNNYFNNINLGPAGASSNAYVEDAIRFYYDNGRTNFAVNTGQDKRGNPLYTTTDLSGLERTVNSIEDENLRMAALGNMPGPTSFNKGNAELNLSAPARRSLGQESYFDPKKDIGSFEALMGRMNPLDVDPKELKMQPINTVKVGPRFPGSPPDCTPDGSGRVPRSCRLEPKSWANGGPTDPPSKTSSIRDRQVDLRVSPHITEQESTGTWTPVYQSPEDIRAEGQSRFFNRTVQEADRVAAITGDKPNYEQAQQIVNTGKQPKFVVNRDDPKYQERAKAYRDKYGIEIDDPSALERLASPMAQMEYYNRYGELPNRAQMNLESTYGNPIDLAGAVYNPFSYVQSAMDAANAASKGNYGEAALSGLGVLPGYYGIQGAKALARQVSPLAKKGADAFQQGVRGTFINAPASSQVSKGVSGTSSLIDEVLGEIVRGKSNRKAIKEGNEWLENWINHPSTQQKIDNSLSPRLDLIREEIDKANANQDFLRINKLLDEFDKIAAGMQQAQTFVPNSKEYPLITQLRENLNQYKIKDAREPIHSGNRGVSYMHGYDPQLRRSIEQGQYTPSNRYGSWISRKLSMPQSKRVGTTIHEGTHDWVPAETFDRSGMRNTALDNMNPDIKKDFLEWEDLVNKGIDPKTVMGQQRAYQAYLADPTEQHARIMELRKQLNITPGYEMDLEDAEKVFYWVEAGGSNIDPNFLNVIDRDPKKLAELFNKFWMAPAAAVGAGAAAVAGSEPRQIIPPNFRYGGPISYQNGGPTDPLKKKIEEAPLTSSDFDYTTDRSRSNIRFFSDPVTGEPFPLVNLPEVEIVETLTRDENGNIIFSSPEARDNYFAYKNLGEQGLRDMQAMKSGIRETTGNFANTFLVPPAMVAGTVLGGAPLVGPVARGASFLNTALQAPMQFGSRTIPGVTGYNLLGASGAGVSINEFANPSSTTRRSIGRAIQDPTTGNILDASGNTLVSSLGFVGIGAANAMGPQLRSLAKNAGKQLAGSRVASSVDDVGKRFYHAGLEPNATLDDIDITRLAQRQQKKGSEYAGFYMSPDLNEGSWALKYSKENPTKGLHEITLTKDAKGFVRESSMERITKQEIEKLQKQGYDYIEGKNMFGQPEYVLLNKNKASMKKVNPSELIKNKNINEEIVDPFGGNSKKYLRTSEVEYNNGLKLKSYIDSKTKEANLFSVEDPKTGGSIFYERGTTIDDNWKPAYSDSWKVKADMSNADKDLIKFANKEIEKIVPSGLIKSEPTSISSDGLRYWNQQSKHGYSELEKFTNPKISASGKDDLFKGLDYKNLNDDIFSGAQFASKKEAEKAKLLLEDFMKKNGIPNYKIKVTADNYLEIDMPKLQRQYQNGGSVQKSYGGGLRRWFKEDWTDVKTGKPCGRESASDSSRPYPYCRPKTVVSSQTPATTKHPEAKSRAKAKTGPTKVTPIKRR